jgi:recombination protein RecR
VNPIDKLSQYFAKFPGIGERQAKRFVYFLLSSNKDYVSELTHLISELKKQTSQCKMCFKHFEYPDREFCEICIGKNTDKSLLMVIEKDADYESMKKSGTYGGNYFILGGLVPITEKDTEKRIRIRELLQRVEKDLKENGLKEIIIAMSLNPHGEHTDIYIRKMLSPLQEKYSFKISSLGRGLSTGTELEYSDSDTIKNALKNRQ